MKNMDSGRQSARLNRAPSMTEVTPPTVKGLHLPTDARSRPQSRFSLLRFPRSLVNAAQNLCHGILEVVCGRCRRPAAEKHPTGRTLKTERLHAMMGDGGIHECAYAQNCV